VVEAAGLGTERIIYYGRSDIRAIFAERTSMRTDAGAFGFPRDDIEAGDGM
jgi:hypothetical protein